ncbi:MAG: hypothetical protein HOO85_03975 [Methylotenera sp.]|nr:hypothetical protein [Methylotenera sp.]
MSNQQVDPIEQAVTGQTPLPNVNNAITKVLTTDEQAQQTEQLNSSRSDVADSASDSLKTLGGLIQNHIPEYQREDMMKLLLERINSKQQENLLELDKADMKKNGGFSI